MNSGTRKELVDILLISSTISVIVFIVYAFLGMYPFGNGLISRGDMTQQAIPAMMYYWDVIHGNASPFFCWLAGLGLNITGAMNLGGFLNPLNLFLFLSPRDNIPSFTNILFVFKMVATSIAMYTYLKRYKGNRGFVILGSILYSFAGASLIHYHIMLIMDAAFLFPLIILGTKKLKEEKPALLITTLTISLATNVYTTIFALIYVFLNHGCEYFIDKRNISQRGKSTLYLGFSVVLAFLLSSVISIPSILCISNSPKMSVTIWEKYLDAIINPTWDIEDTYQLLRMPINSALPMAIIVGFILTNTNDLKGCFNKYKSRFVMLIMLLVSALVPSVEILWYGGSRTCWPIRFIYVITFFVIDFALEILEENYSFKYSIISKKNITIIGISALLIVIVTTFISKCLYPLTTGIGIGWADGIICILCELICAILLIMIFKKKTIKSITLILFVLAVEISLTSYVNLYPNKYIENEYNPVAFEETEAITDLLDNSAPMGIFSRIKNYNYEYNAPHYPLITNREAISNFWHVVNVESMDTLHGLGYSILFSSNLDMGGTLFSDALIQNDYVIAPLGLPETLYTQLGNGELREGISVYESKLSLPLVNSIDDNQFTYTDDMFAVQNEMFSTITSIEQELITDVSDQISSNELLLDLQGRKFLYFYATNSPSRYGFIDINDNPVIISNQTFTNNTAYFPVGENYLYRADSDNVSNYSGLVSLGYFEDETIDIKFYGDITADEMHIGVLDVDLLTEGLDNAIINAPVITSISRGNQSLNLSLDNINGNYVILPIMYIDGWTCTVNNHAVEIGNYHGLMCIPVNGQSSDISLRFNPPGLFLGAILSFIGLILTICLSILLPKYNALFLSKFADCFFAILFWIVVLVMFGGPMIGRIVMFIKTFLWVN